MLWNVSSHARIYHQQLPGPVSVLLPWRNMVFVAGGGSDVSVLDFRTFEKIGSLRGHRDIVHLAEKILSKQLLATSSLDKSMRIWSVPAFKCVKTFTFEVCIASMSASEEPDAISIFALFEDNVVRRINIENGQTLIRWQINHEISPAFISVLNQSVFVAWRDSEVSEASVHIQTHNCGCSLFTFTGHGTYNHSWEKIVEVGWALRSS
jgi:WD40 repeat protein